MAFRKYFYIVLICYTAMDSKKAQVTLFIIIGILMLAAIGVFYYIMYNTTGVEEQDQIQNFESGSGPVATYLRVCINNLARDAITLTPSQGGYLALPEHSTAGHSLATAYYYYDDTLDIPTKQAIGLAISGYVTQNLDECLGADVFEQQGLAVKKGEAKTTTLIGINEITVSVENPAVVQQADGVKEEISGVSVRIPSKMYDSMLDAAKNITQDYKENGRQFCLSCLLSLSEEKNIKAMISTPEDKHYNHGVS